MAKVEIDETLIKQIIKKFKGDSEKIIDLMESLEKNPKKGKAVGNIERTVIKEIKYKSFRFFFVTDGYALTFYSEEELTDLLIQFVRMAHKRKQQETIEEIRNILIKIGPKGL